MHTTSGREKEETAFFYGKNATLGWDPECWRWANGFCFLNYTTKMGNDKIFNMVSYTTRAANKWQGYILRNYQFYWSYVWDPMQYYGKEDVFMWSIWHKQLQSGWKVRITPTSISK